MKAPVPIASKAKTATSANGWTGGQYSLVRTALGVYLLVHFLHLIAWGREVFSSAGVLSDAAWSPLIRAFPNVLAIADGPGAVTALLVLGAASAVLFAIGWFDRVAAIVMWYILACLFGRNPLIANPSLPFVGWALLMHACLPGRPYGSVGALGRSDPGGGWRFPPAIFGAAWIVMSIAYSYSGYTKLVSPSWMDGSALARVLENPLARPSVVRDALLAMPAVVLKGATWGALGLELLFAPLAIFRPLRRWLWLAMVCMHIGLLTLIDFADLSAAMLVFHLFVFDPAWLRGETIGGGESGAATLFYDGHCGLCHRTVRFVMAEDAAGERFRFAPLQGETCSAMIPQAQRKLLGDTLILFGPDRSVRTKSSAVIAVLAGLGGWWRVFAAVLKLVPRALRDVAYDGVAGVRERLFAQPEEACPLVPPELRKRFLP